MEEKKEIELTQSDFEKTKKAEKVHSGTGLKVACGLLALATLGLGGFIVYDKIFATQSEKVETSVSTQKQTENSNTKKQEQTVKNNNGFVGSYSTSGLILVDGAGDVYFEPNNDISHVQGMEAYNFNLKDENVDGEKGIYSFNKEEIKYHPTAHDGQKIEFNGYKLNIKNIISLAEVGIGHQSYEYTWLALNQNGDTYMIIVKPGERNASGNDNTGSTEAKIRVRKLKYKNIISASMIDMGDSVGTVMTDKNGSHFYLTDEDFKYE